MSKTTLRDSPNKYWGYSTPPPECCLTIHCSSLDRAGLRRYVKDLAGEGLYYSHSQEKKQVTLAFESAEMRKIHEDFLKLNALKEGRLLDKDLKASTHYLLPKIMQK